MDNSVDHSCINCKYYNDKYAPTGFCTLYRHNVTLPDLICSKYEKCDEENINREDVDEKADKPISTENKKKSFIQGLKIRQVVYIGGVFSCIMYLILSVILCFLFIRSMSQNAVPMPLCIGLSAISILFTVGMNLLIFTLVRKYEIARMISFFIMAVALVCIIVSYESFWFGYSRMIDELITKLI